VAVAYVYDDTLYLAITKRCTLACTFCPKTHGRMTVAGNDMRPDRELDAQTILDLAHAALPGLRSRNVAFVGLGEPTMRLPVLVEVGRRLRAEGLHVRVQTDGLANLRAGRDVSPELDGAVDEVSVSLNAPDPATYARLCPSAHGEAAHAAVCDFIEAVRDHGIPVIATVVEAPGVDIAATQALADRLRVPLRVRPYFDPTVGEPHESPAARAPARSPV
jgi:TatD DNase family protein